MPAPIWKTIFHGAYKINKSGTIIREAKAMGTWHGRRLTPYSPDGVNFYVKLHYGDYIEQVNVKTLVQEVFK